MVKKLLLILLLPVYLLAEQYINSQSKSYPGLRDVMIHEWRYDGSEGNTISDQVGSNNMSVAFLGDSTSWNPSHFGMGLWSDAAYDYSTGICSTVISAVGSDTAGFTVSFIANDMNQAASQRFLEVYSANNDNRILIYNSNGTNNLSMFFEGNTVVALGYIGSVSDGDTVNLSMFWYKSSDDSLTIRCFYRTDSVFTTANKSLPLTSDFIKTCTNATLSGTAPTDLIVSYYSMQNFEGQSMSIAACSLWYEDMHDWLYNQRIRQIAAQSSSRNYIACQAPDLFTISTDPVVSWYDFNGTGGATVDDMKGSNDLIVTCLNDGGDSVSYRPGAVGMALMTGNYSYAACPCSTKLGSGFDSDTGFCIWIGIVDDINAAQHQEFMILYDAAAENRFQFWNPSGSANLQFNFEGNNNNKSTNWASGLSDGDTTILQALWYYNGSNLIVSVWQDGNIVGSITNGDPWAASPDLFSVNDISKNATSYPLIGSTCFSIYGSFEGLGWSVAQCSLWCISAYQEMENKRLRQIAAQSSSLVGFGEEFRPPEYDSIVAMYFCNRDSVDSTGNGHNFHRIGGAAYITSMTGFGQACSLDGTDDWDSIPDHNDFSFGDGSNDIPFSISTWIFMKDASNFFIICKNDGGGANVNKEYIFFTDGSDRLSAYLYNQIAGAYIARYYSSGLSGYENQWIHVAMSYDGSGNATGIKLFLNGSQVDNTTASGGSYTAMENLSHYVSIGARPTNAQYANGYIDQLIIYRNWILTPIQITYLYSQGPVMNYQGRKPR